MTEEEYCVTSDLVRIRVARNAVRELTTVSFEERRVLMRVLDDIENRVDSQVDQALDT